MKYVLAKLLINLVRSLIGSNFFGYIEALVRAQLDTNLTGEQKRAEVKKQIENLKNIGTEAAKDTVQEGLIIAAQSTKNKYVNLAIEVIVAAL